MKRARDKEEEEEEDDDTTDHAAKIPFIEHSSATSPLFPPFLPGELWCVVAAEGNFAECAGDSHMSDGMSTFLLGQTCRAINLSLTSMRKKLSRPHTLPWLMKYHATALVAWGLEIEPDYDPRYGINLLHIGLWRRPMSAAGLKPFWFGWSLGWCSVQRWRTLACWYGQVAVMRVIEFDLGISWENPAAQGTLDPNSLPIMAAKHYDVPMLAYFIKESHINKVTVGTVVAEAILDQPGLFERLDPINNSFNIFLAHKGRTFRSQLIMAHYDRQLDEHWMKSAEAAKDNHVAAGAPHSPSSDDDASAPQ